MVRLVTPLLPLWEKVSAKPTDEGFSTEASAQPLIRPASRATFSHKGRRI